MESSYETSIVVFGVWEDQKDLIMHLVRQLSESPSGYIFSGHSLYDMQRKILYGSCFDKLVPEEGSALCEAVYSDLDYLSDTNNRISVSDIKSELFIMVPIGSLEHLKNICDLISDIFKIGGVIVSIGNNRYAIHNEKWNKFSFDLGTIFNIFVSVAETEGGIRTYGMLNFSQRDVFTSLEYDDDSVERVLTFAAYLVFENPQINEGDTFSGSELIFVITNLKDPEQEKLYNNPLGLYQLSSVKS